MDCLPRDLMHKILFMTDHRSVAMMRCTNRSLQMHTNDPDFESEYSSRVGSGLVHISASGSSYLSYNPNGDSRSHKTEDALKESHILGSCSGLLLLFIDDHLCVVNPVTKKFRFFNQSWFMRFTGVFCHTAGVAVNRGNKKHIGLAVDRNTKSFKIVHMVDVGTDYESRYRFEINRGNSWRRPKTTLTCLSSVPLKTPVYLDGSLHWLREDGSIVSFNLNTEHARLIPISFPRGLCFKTLFTLVNNRLTLISATEEDIYVYALENSLLDPKWVFVKKIQNIVMDKRKLSYWNVEAYKGNCLVLREDREKEGLFCDQVVHVYDLSSNKWVFMGSTLGWCSANQDFFLFTPSTSYVVGLDEILPCTGRRMSSLSSIMALVDGSSSEKVEKQLRKRSAGHNFFY